MDDAAEYSDGSRSDSRSLSKSSSRSKSPANKPGKVKKESRRYSASRSPSPKRDRSRSSSNTDNYPVKRSYSQERKSKKSKKSKKHKRRYSRSSSKSSLQSRSQTRSRSPISKTRTPRKRRTHDRHGNPLTPLVNGRRPGSTTPPPQSRQGGFGYQLYKEDKERRLDANVESVKLTEVSQVQGSNIYQRPDGPRTGTGYPENGIVEIRFLVPSKIAGTIIGKKGENVMKLRKKHGVEIGVPDCHGSIDRMVIIRGINSTDAIDAATEIADVPLKIEMMRGLHLNRDHTQLRVLIHNSVCGAIIGNKGSVIHDIRSVTGSDVHVYSDCCPESTDRIVKLTGRVSEVRDSLKMIFKLLSKAFCKGDERNYEVKYSTGNEEGRDYGGWKVCEVRSMGDPTHNDKYHHMRAKRDKQKNALDRYGNLRIRERHGDRRERSKSRSPSVDSDPDHKYYKGKIKSRKKQKIQEFVSKYDFSEWDYRTQKTNPPKLLPPDKNIRSYDNNTPGTKDSAKKFKESLERAKHRARNSRDAPAYEGPNSSGPNRMDRKRQHPLTALDLKMMEEKQAAKYKRDKMLDLLN